jgi:hypothetical protein
MPRTSDRALGQPPARLTKRILLSLSRRARRRVFLPGNSLADGLRRAGVFVVGWGTVIGLLAWGAYRQGVLHGVGDGITICAALFLLAVYAAPDYMGPGGRQGRNQY